MHYNVIIKDGDTTKDIKKVLVDGVQFVDDAPIEGSSNLVSSNGVAKAISDTKDAVDEETADLQQQIDDIAEKAGSGYIPKGEASVATLNALSGQENGELYTMTDAGTLTEGSLAVSAGDTVAWDEANSVWYKAMDYAPRQYGTNEVHNLATTITAFRTGDYIVVDGTSGTAKMSKDDLLSLGVNVSYEENLKKYAPITPKKACIMFEMDCNANGVNSHLDEYADTLEQYGIKRSTFFPHSDLMDGSNPLYVSIMQRMQARGNEVSIHSVASDGIGQTDTSPAPTLSQFETIMQGYVSSFEGVGLSPIGWVTSRGTIHAEFREPLRKWVAYGHTLANKTAYPNFNVSTYVNDTDTDRLNILRIGLEYSAGEGETQADVDAEMLQCAKDAVDYAVANGDLVCFYAHSYKTTTIPYTMRAEVLEPLLAYIKTNYIDKHLIVSGTGAEVCKYYFG